MSVAPRIRQARRNWGTNDLGCNILHVDMDSFFASVELLDNPNLVGHPVIVGGRNGRGVVCAATYEARAFGIRAGMPVGKAQGLCPQAVFLPTRHDRYQQASAAVMQALSFFTPAIEPISVDEAFLDVSGALKRLGSPAQIAAQIRENLRAETGLAASVGIAGSKLVAKIASAHAKPDGTLLIPVERTQDFLNILPIGAMWGIGPRTRALLQTRGIETVEDLTRLPLQKLIKLLGNSHGMALHFLCQGIDTRPVGLSRVDKSFSVEITFPEDISSSDVLESVLLDQSHQCAARLRREGARARTVAIKVRAADFTTVTRSRSLAVPTDLGREIAQVARELFHKVGITRGGVRLIGVRVEQLIDAHRDGFQGLLDEDNRQRAAEIALDNVRQKFGSAALGPATLLANND